MTYAPPSETSAYDVAVKIAEAIANIFATITVPSLQNIINMLQSLGVDVQNMILNPMLNAMKSGLEYLYEILRHALGSALRALTGFVYQFFIKPFLDLAQYILNKIYEKLEGIIFIAITVPAVIIEIKDFMHKPSWKKGLMIALKPLLGYIVAKLASSFIKPMIKPPVLTPPSPPSDIEILEPLKEISMPCYDVVLADDYASIEIPPTTSIRDSMSLTDMLNVESRSAEEYLDSASITDNLQLQLIDNVPLQPSDSVSIAENVSLEVS